MSAFFASTRQARRRAALLQERQRQREERSAHAAIWRELNRVANAAAAGGSLTAIIASHVTRLEKIFTLVYRRATGVVITQMTDDVGKARPVVLQHKALDDEAMNEWIAEQTAKKVKAISKTTREIIRSAIQEGVEKELSQSLTARLIREKTGGLIGNRRAQMIARTETHTAAQHAALQTVKDLELPVKKVWVSVEDDRTRESHRVVDGQTRKLDKDFSVNGSSLAFPGDPAGPPEETINCRCAVVFEEAQ